MGTSLTWVHLSDIRFNSSPSLIWQTQLSDIRFNSSPSLIWQTQLSDIRFNSRLAAACAGEIGTICPQTKMPLQTCEPSRIQT